MSAPSGQPGERRHWLRLTGACNNGCLFCLDSDFRPKGPRPFEELLAELARARAEGASRVILSGGEPSTHPRFLDLVAAARQEGFAWVQVISNGRMFSYRDFAARALAAGLDEVTISLHGDSALLHDHLTGVPGAFAQATQGLRHLLGRCVVSVDIVLARAVMERLPLVLEYFADLGVREFDLLYPVPFGRAWANWQELSWRPGEFSAQLAQALTLARQRGLTVWTNRLPAAALEGFEEYIQDPEKLLDEVRGRRAFLEALLARGQRLPCFGPRCGFCHIRGFCTWLEGLSKGPATAAGPGGSPEAPSLEALALRYIKDLWYERGRCCEGCALAGSCPGLPIEEVRKRGFVCSRRRP
jgi:MoaA/NifB/PqqE/SkfB family radical SAM enzyme